MSSFSSLVVAEVKGGGSLRAHGSCCGVQSCPGLAANRFEICGLLAHLGLGFLASDVLLEPHIHSPGPPVQFLLRHHPRQGYSGTCDRGPCNLRRRKGKRHVNSEPVHALSVHYCWEVTAVLGVRPPPSLTGVV